MKHPLETEELARQICTLREAEAFILWNRGAGYRRVANLLGISMTTARDRIARARRKLDNHQAAA